MKFSYSLIKEMVPNLPSKIKFADELALKSFEVDDISGDMMDIKITANRWCDAASHIGIAREAAAIFGLRLIPLKVYAINKIKKGLNIKVVEGSGCFRYIGCLTELRKKGSTPSWMKKYLKTCGLRPISPVVDVLNYVMIETGQPMHAFDADKVEGGITVRKAKKGEKMITIDGGEYDLLPTDTVIADDVKVLAIAGIKGGKAAEITSKTKNVIVESANFDSVSVYRTSKRIKLDTDASRRYGHGMSSEKAGLGISRALKLLEQICFAKPLLAGDEYKKKESKRVIKFDPERFESITGVAVTTNQAGIILKKLGFGVRGNLIEVPAERIDVEIFEDIVEEVIRIYGLDEVEAKAPIIPIVPLHNDPIVEFREKIKRAFVNTGFSEVLSYSFGDFSEGAVELMNPISKEKAYMRTDLVRGLNEVVEKNRRSFDDIKIFEFGKVFDGVGKEHWSVAAAVRIKGDDQSLRMLRGATEAVLKNIGITEFELIPEGNKSLILKIGGRRVGTMFLEKSGISFFEANAEILLDESQGEFEYKPVSPYPSVQRDVSFWAKNDVTVGGLLEAINISNIPNLEDVDLVDYYPEASKERFGITLRFLFQSTEKTLTEAEVDVWMEKIKEVLMETAGVEIR